MHGKSCSITLDNTSPLFANLHPVIEAGRYHSLAADPLTIPETLRVTARTKDGEIMAGSHTEYAVYGLQFHPESILTPCGKQIVENFLRTKNVRQNIRQIEEQYEEHNDKRSDH